MEYQKTELHRPISIFDGNISDAYPIIQKAKKVYLPNGLVDLRYLLSAHDGHPESLVVAPDWIASSTLLIELFGRDRIISIGEEPSVSGRPLPADERRILFESLEKQANALLSTFGHIGADAELIAFTQFNVFPWYVLIGLFRRMGASIRYIDIHQRWLQMISLKEEPTGELGKAYEVYFSELSRIAGIGVSPRLYEPLISDQEGGAAASIITAEGTGLTDTLQSADFEPLSWREIGEKYAISVVSPKREAVIVMETPFRPYWPTVDVSSTYQRVAKHLFLSLDPETEIHFKPHFENIDFNPFDDTIIGDRVKRLPSDIPAELYIPHYEAVYFFGTTAAKEPTEKKLYCMRGLIDFSADEYERLRFEMTNFCQYGDYEANFIFVE